LKLFRTIIEPTPLFSNSCTWESPIFCLGSCFAEGIARQLSELGLNCLANPPGVLYNPLSTAKFLGDSIEEKKWNPEDLYRYQGQSFSLHHHSSIHTQEPLTEVLNQLQQQSRDFLQQAQMLVVTHGTSYVYRLRESGESITNCHRLPADLFKRCGSTESELYEAWAELIPQLLKLNPELKIVFTVSPIRHLRDHFRENQLSKSTLHLFTERLCREFPDCAYFPSYEIMMDELRDYRFYAEDMCHPTPVALEFITDKFLQAAFSANCDDYFARAAKIAAMRRHHVQDREAGRQFLAAINNKISALQATYPGCFKEKEI